MTLRVACLEIFADRPELVQHGVSGFLAAERDATALAARLCHLAAHPEVWPALCAAGRARIERDYDIERLNGRPVALLTELTHGARDR